MEQAALGARAATGREYSPLTGFEEKIVYRAGYVREPAPSIARLVMGVAKFSQSERLQVTD
jgi:hypothetical protein